MFKRGDNVKLKCGGPFMTVTAGPGESYFTDISTARSPENYVRVRWFNANGELQEDTFHVDSLEAAIKFTGSRAGPYPMVGPQGGTGTPPTKLRT